jgi:hypothetical protein
MSWVIAVVGLTSVVLSLYTFVRDPRRREMHRFYQASRLEYDGFQPPYLMCWTYRIGVEKLFFRSKIRLSP